MPQGQNIGMNVNLISISIACVPLDTLLGTPVWHHSDLKRALWYILLHEGWSFT